MLVLLLLLLFSLAIVFVFHFIFYKLLKKRIITTICLSSISMYLCTLGILVLPNYIMGNYETEVGNFVTLPVLIITVSSFVSIVFYIFLIFILSAKKNK